MVESWRSFARGKGVRFRGEWEKKPSGKRDGGWKKWKNEFGGLFRWRWEV